MARIHRADAPARGLAVASIGRLLRGLAVLACVLWLVWPVHAHASNLVIDRVLAAPGVGPSFPVAFATEVRLPDAWHRSQPGSTGPVWYRARFEVQPRPGEPARGLWIARACTTLQVQLNGVTVHRPGRLDEPTSFHCQMPHLVLLPDVLLLPGLNTLDIQLVGHALPSVSSRHRAASLSVLELGWHDELVARHDGAMTFARTLPQALSATLLLLGSFMFALGFARRQDSHLAYFGALCFAWALGDARLWLGVLPLPNAAVEFLVASLLPFLTLCGVQFMLRHVRLRLRWVNLALPLQCALMPLSLIVAGPGRLYPMVMTWELLLMAQLLAAGIVFVRAVRRQARPLHVRALLALTLAATCAAGIVELATQFGGEREALAQAAMLVPPLMFALVGLHLVHEHGRALDEVEQIRALLEQRVREATAEAERNFEQLAELRVEQVTQQERKRIAADLHDDLGAKLLTIVHTSESDRISTLAREALEEMRLSVRGLTGRAVLLADAIGDWRAEVVSRLGQAGIEAQWTAPEDDELLQRLSARAYVQTTRILREATSNIIKHSGASRCIVECAVHDGDFVLIIRDNGNGIASDVEMRIDRGHGLASMKQRAKQLQGQCLVESGPGYGTVIRLTLPMDRATERT